MRERVNRLHGISEEKFSDVAVMPIPKEPGLFDRAEDRFKKDPKYRDYTEVIDEVWFFFDVETKDVNKWDERYRIIKNLENYERIRISE